MNSVADQPVALQLINTPAGRGPVTCGIPWPRGALHNVAGLALWNRQDRPVCLQTRVLDLWPDGSVRWALLDWQADAAEQPYRLAAVDGNAVAWQTAVSATLRNGSVNIDAGSARFELGAGRVFPFRSVYINEQPAIDAARTRLVAETDSGRTFLPRIDRIEVEEPGPVRVVIRLQGEFAADGSPPLADFDARL